jgi:hypothetical protein
MCAGVARMKNLTLAIDEKVLEKVRRYAARRDTTVNAIVREHLGRIARNDDRAREAIRELREMSDRSDAEIGPIAWTRDDLYAR